MKEIKSLCDDYNIYLTEADYSSEAIYVTHPNLLNENIKLFSLLGKYVVLAAAHIFESKATYELLFNNPELLEREIVVIDLRNDCRDFIDFLSFQRSKKKNDKKWHTKNMDNIASFLNNHCPGVIYWNPKKEEDIFKKILLDSFKNYKSTLRKRMIGIKKDNIQEAIQIISNSPRLTRSILKKIALKHFPARFTVLMEEVNAAYYLSGAKDMNLNPALHPKYFSNCKLALNNIKEGKWSQETLKKFFSVLLNTNGINTEILQTISTKSLNNVRNLSITNDFRKKWWNILKNVTSDEDIMEKLKILSDFEGKVENHIKEEVRKEFKKEKSFNKIKKTATATSLITSGLSLIPYPVISAISFALSLLTYSPVSNKLGEKIFKRELSIICSRLHKEFINDLGKT